MIWMIYFDNAATTFPKPKRVKEAVASVFNRYGANPGRSGHALSMDTAVKVFECREAAMELFDAAAVEDVVFTMNCTHAINMAIKGALRQGDHVIISDLEHNSVLRPVHTLAQRGQITYSIAEVDEDDDERTLASFQRLIQPKTKMIACTHGSNVWGLRLPLQALGALAQKQDLLFLVDAAQTAGVVDIDMQRDGIDFLCTAGHKGLYGPSGTGLLITPLGLVLGTVMEGGTGNMSALYEQPLSMPERLESGTVNTTGILGLGAGISYVREKGVQKLYAHEAKLARQIYTGLRKIPRVRLYTKDFKIGRHLPVISFNIDGHTSEEVVAMLSDKGFALRGGLHCAPLAHRKMGTMESGAVRVSVGAFNTSSQAEALLGAITRIAK